MDFCKRTRVVIGASALLLVAGAALADNPAPFPECTKTPSADDVEAAKQSHTIATSRFNLQDWDKAIEFWKQAYAFDCTAHALLVNIANAHEKKGDKRAAIAALETYLVRAPGAPDLIKINERVVDLKKSLEPVPTATAATATATATVLPTVTATATAPPPSGERPFGPIPLVVAGVGGAIAVAGAILNPVGFSQYEDARLQCPEETVRSCTDLPPGPDKDRIISQGNAGRDMWNAGGALLGVGLVVAAGGLGWHFLFNKPRPAAPLKDAAPKPAPAKAHLDVMPVIHPQVGGVVVTGKF